MVPETLILGVPLIVLVPAVVQLAKASGLAVRWAGLAAVVAAGVLAALADLAVRGDGLGSVAGYVLAGLVYGLAAAGLYSQVRVLGHSPAGGESGGGGTARLPGTGEGR
jgi:hypothetical protein